MPSKPIRYEDLVNYKGFDPFKIACQEAGRRTTRNLRDSGFQELTWSRGESAFVMKAHRGYFANVIEGLGTKNIIAEIMDELAKLPGLTEETAIMLRDNLFFRQIAQCNAAMVINDLITSGARPTSFMLHVAVGTDKWFENKRRWQDIIYGTEASCHMAQCVWGCGETPVLRDIVNPSTVLLSGSATGFIKSKARLINPANIQDGDRIMLFDSSGIMANGSTLVRQIAPSLPHGYLTRIPEDGRTFGEAILAPTTIYSRLIQAILDAEVRIHYAVNITGHGWRKLMRPVQSFTYIITQLPTQQPLFKFIQENNGNVSDRKMYETFNMGAGFAIYVDPKDVATVLRVTKRLRKKLGLPFKCTHAGYIEKSSEPQVIIKPKNIEFGPKDLEIRK